MKRKSSYPADPKASELVRRIESDDPDEVMPQDPDKRLSAEQIALLRAWVGQGANFRDHWAYEKPIKAALPEVRSTKWPQGEIDRFVLARLEAKGLKPSPRRTGQRSSAARLWTLQVFCLHRKEVEAFVGDMSVGAYEKVVDRLLKSKRYGEHRARYWMDYARFGDTSGLHRDSYQSRWPYRDWVIKAFNGDMPYDRFTIEQLARRSAAAGQRGPARGDRVSALRHQHGRGRHDYRGAAGEPGP